MIKLSAVIIALNEGKKIKDCLSSLSFCDEIVLVDSGSFDGTVEIAKTSGTKVFTRSFDDFASQKNFGVEKASGEWILSVDADERVDEKLRQCILEKIASNPKENAFRFKRSSFLFGQRFHFSGTQDDTPVRLFKRGNARFEGRIHETLSVQGGTGKIEGELLHFTFQNVNEYLRRLNHYTSLEAGKKRKGGRFLVKAFSRFADVYFLKQGFRDGDMGLRYSLLSGWYEIMKSCKAWENGNAGL